MSVATLALLAGAAAVGIIAGVARGGELRNLAHHGVRWTSALVLGAALLMWVDRIAPDPSTELTIVAMVLVMAFVARNLHLVGFSVVLLGAALNLGGVIANSGTSVDRAAAVGAGVIEASSPGIDLGHAGRHLRDHSDRAWWLGEIVPVEPLRDVVSFGDLIAAAGVANAAYRLSQRKVKRSPALSPSARAGLVSIEAASTRIDDDPVIDLRLVAEASQKGYAEAWRNAREVTRVHPLHTPPDARPVERSPIDLSEAPSTALDPSTIGE